MSYNSTLTSYISKKTKQCIICKKYFDENDIDEEVCRACERLKEGDENG